MHLQVFVAGATGQTGARVVQALRAQNISVVAGVRDLKKASAAGFDQDSGITVKLADVTKPPECAPRPSRPYNARCLHECGHMHGSKCSVP